MALSSASKTLSDFLQTQKTQYLEAVEEGKGGDWVIVTGNEAGDLDSLSSAIGFAWYLSAIEQTLAVPLVHTPRSDLRLRAENLYALELAGVETVDPLLCVDDVPSTASPFPSTKFALVDHNKLHARFRDHNPDARVVSIIDHHADEGLYKDTAKPRIITVRTGSASSLVAHYLEERCPDKIPPELATLLLCTILIDTNGLKVGGKAEEADRAATAFLIPRSLLAAEGSDLNITELHNDTKIQELSSALANKKGSVSHLNTRELLQRDYKEYTMVPSWEKDKSILAGLASVPVGLKPWIARDIAFWSSIEKWMADRKIAVLGILTSFRDEEKVNKHGKPKHKREQLFVVRKGEIEDLAKKLFKGLEENKELKLKRKDFKVRFGVKKAERFSSDVDSRVWNQKNVDATRKVTAPVVRAIIEGDKSKASL
ncbi:unnamed protein product [Somion occarium]|uniref:DHHA2 domain-containing protein n=1 Tax=Somion occarium TaxID=3059160 RepID=A0ABP1DQC1_9APHY